MTLEGQRMFLSLVGFGSFRASLFEVEFTRERVKETKTKLEQSIWRKWLYSSQFAESRIQSRDAIKH